MYKMKHFLDIQFIGALSHKISLKTANPSQKSAPMNVNDSAVISCGSITRTAKLLCSSINLIVIQDFKICIWLNSSNGQFSMSFSTQNSDLIDITGFTAIYS